MLPVTLGLGLININAVIDTFFAARLIDPDLAPSAIDAAFRIYMLPQGIFSVAVATVLFPTLSRLAARDDSDGFRSTVALGLRQIAFLLVPASVVARCSPSRSSVSLYERGSVHARPDDGRRGRARRVLARPRRSTASMLMLNRAFFSLQSPWLPTAVALGNLGLNAVLDAAFYSFGVWGHPACDLARRTSPARPRCSSLLRRRIGGIDARATASASSRIVIASASPAAVVAYGVWRALDDVLGHGRSGRSSSRCGGARRRRASCTSSACRALRSAGAARRCYRCDGASGGA